MVENGADKIPVTQCLTRNSGNSLYGADNTPITYNGFKGNFIKMVQTVD